MTVAPTDVFVNYYEILGLPPTADVETIEQKIKEEIRTWRRRTGSPDLSKRQEAELRMQHLAAARENLLDPGKRSAYDRRLSTQQRQSPQPTMQADGRNWLALGEEYLAQNDYHSAAYAAREATQTEGNSAVAWNLRGRANAGLGHLNDALYETRQAAEIDSNNAQYHFDLGSVCEQMQRWKDALTAYEAASRLDPSDFVYRLSVAGVYVQNDLPGKAMPIVEEVYRAHPDEELVNCVLAETLARMAELVPAHRDDDGYMITSAEEIVRMEAMVERAKGLPHLDPELKSALNGITDYIDTCKNVKFSPPPFLADRGLGAIAAVLLAPIIGILVALGSFGENPGAGFLLLLVFGLVGYGVSKLFWVPQWKRNKRSLS